MARHLLLLVFAVALSACEVSSPEPAEPPEPQWHVLLGPEHSIVLTRLVGTSQGTHLALGQGGRLYELNGPVWTDHSPPDPMELWDAQILADGTLIVVGNAPRLWIRQGSRWSSRPAFGIDAHRSLFAASVDEIYTAGSHGRLVLTTPEGSAPVVVNTAVDVEITHVFGTDASNIYAVGSDGLFHWDGATWEEILLGVSTEIVAMGGLPTGEFFFLAQGQILYVFDGENFVIDDLSLPVVFIDAFMPEPGRVVLVGNRGQQVVWETFQTSTIEMDPPMSSCVGGAVLSDGNTLLLDRSGELRQSDLVDDQFHSYLAPPVVIIQSVWGRTPQDLVVTLPTGEFLHCQEGRWFPRVLDGFTPRMVYGVSNDVLLATQQGIGLALFDGDQWEHCDVAAVAYVGLHGSGPNHLVAGGASGTVSVYDGETWDSHTLPTDRSLGAVWTSGPNDILVAAAPREYAAAYDGTEWTELVGFDQLRGNVRAIWRQGEEPYVVMSNESIHRHDGTAWIEVQPAGERGYWAAWPADGGALLGRIGGELFWFDGEELTPYHDASILSQGNRALSGWSQDGVLLAGTTRLFAWAP